MKSAISFMSSTSSALYQFNGGLAMTRSHWHHASSSLPCPRMPKQQADLEVITHERDMEKNVQLWEEGAGLGKQPLATISCWSMLTSRRALGSATLGLGLLKVAFPKQSSPTCSLGPCFELVGHSLVQLSGTRP